MLTKEGLLVDADGNAVQGQGGDIYIPTDAKQVAISEQGMITADGEVIDSLEAMDFEDYDYLKKFGNTLFEPVEGATEIDGEGAGDTGIHRAVQCKCRQRDGGYDHRYQSL